MSSTWSRTCLVLLLAALVLVIVVDPALAQSQQAASNSSNVGQGLGEMLQGWAKWLIPGVVALVGIPAIARHDFGMAVSIFIVAMLLGAFAFINADQFHNIVQPIVDSISGS